MAYELESNIKALLSSTKKKIASLSTELKEIKRNNEGLKIIVANIREEREVSNKELKEAEDKLLRTKERAVRVIQEREKLQLKVRDKKTEINELNDSIDDTLYQLKSQLKNLIEEEKQIKEDLSKQREMIITTEQYRLDKLEDVYKLKEIEVEKLKQELTKLNSKEQTRIATLEDEKKKLLEFIDNI